MLGLNDYSDEPREPNAETQARWMLEDIEYATTRVGAHNFLVELYWADEPMLIKHALGVLHCGSPDWLSKLLTKARARDTAAAEVIQKVAAREFRKGGVPPVEIRGYIADHLDPPTKPGRKGRTVMENAARNKILTAVVSMVMSERGLSRPAAGRIVYGLIGKMRVHVGGLDNFQAIVRGAMRKDAI